MCIALSIIILQLFFFDFLHQGFWDFLDMCSAFSAARKKKVCLTQIVCLGIQKENMTKKNLFLIKCKLQTQS